LINFNLQVIRNIFQIILDIMSLSRLRLLSFA